RDLYNYATLLYATERVAEAELLMRHTLEILLQFTRATGHRFPELQKVVCNYAKLLEGMGMQRDEVVRRLQSLGPEPPAIFREFLDSQ
ncbi:MAG: hypothetical protein WCK89_19295, partial [bacterium]